jgi:hypothetical protein
MPIGTISSNVSLAGISIQSLITREAEGQISHTVALAAGKAGTLTTRTDDNTGEATLGTGHGMAQNDVVDVYWEDGVRYGMVVGVVAGNVVPIDGGAGDNLPLADTALVVCKQTEINTDFDGDDAVMFAVHSTKRGHANFQDSGDASLEAVDLAANEVWWWAADTGESNPLSGNAVDKVLVSNGTTEAATLKIGVLYESVA